MEKYNKKIKKDVLKKNINNRHKIKIYLCTDPKKLDKLN